MRCDNGGAKILMIKCDGCGLSREAVQTVDVYDEKEHYCIACAEVPA